MYDLVFFSAFSTARLATGLGASMIMWRSCVGGAIRVNLLRFTLVSAGSISLDILVYQLSC